MRIVATFAFTVMAICLGFQRGHAEKGVELVVGNDAYRHGDKLADPVPDGRRMCDTLAELGFGVVYVRISGELAPGYDRGVDAAFGGPTNVAI